MVWLNFLSSGFQQQVHETQGNSALLLKELKGPTKKRLTYYAEVYTTTKTCQFQNVKSLKPAF